METLSELRVRYAETDRMGVVYHANYLVWMEVGRTDLLRRLGDSYAAWEAQGFALPVSHVEITYRAPSRYDEVVQVRCRLEEATRRRLAFSYRIEREGVLLAEGRSVHMVMGPDGRARPLPEALLAPLLARVATAPPS